MIRIRRPQNAPAALLAHGRQRRDEHVAQVAAGKDPAFDRDIYAHPDVKASLRNCQHDKCAFCESKVSHVAFGDIEHFRPKAAYRTTEQAPLTKPGYFWLAYEWTNLLFACEPCNRRNKGNLFPLADERTRARSLDDDVALEAAVFVDPATEDPAAHIGFREEYAYAVGGSARGEATLRALGLDRPELVERRRERLHKLRLLKRAADTLRRKRDRESKDLAREIADELRQAAEDGAEFAAAMRSALGSACM